ncbi:MAG: sulfotransferase, partial [Pseudomonadota bacterium]
MIWILITLASLASVELFLRLPVVEKTRGVLTTSRRSINVVASKAISDHWKERILPHYSLRMASGSLSAAGLMILAFSPIIALALIGPLFGADVMGLLLSWQGIVGISLIAALYIFLRNRLFGRASPDAGESAYSPMAKLTHRLALAAPARGELLLDLEHATASKPTEDARHGRHIFVAGLARAGTTVLMRAIYESGGFASLTYRDMPFVMAPNLWARLSRRSQRAMDKTERAHGDSVLVDFDSPEALEEPFWRSFCRQDYIKPDRLIPHAADDEAVDAYRKFVGHVLVRYGEDRYLAKNNNNILRLPTLLKAFPAATAVIPFRHPVAQATSLMDQHQRFLATDDPFTQDYMGWLAHHEFGPGHRPF